MKNYPAVIIIICFALSLCNCRKTKNLPVIELDVDSAVGARFNYKPGTYWIYKDSISGRTDSFFVRSNVYSKQADQREIYDFHLITVVELSLDTLYKSDSANWVFNYQGTNIVVDYYYGQNFNSWYGFKNDIRFSPLFSYPFQVGSIKSSFDSVLVTGIDSSLVVNGLPFLSVAVIHQYLDADSTQGPGITKINDWYYINDSVGIIQMQLSHPYHAINRNWKLKRYNIVR